MLTIQQVYWTMQIINGETGYKLKDCVSNIHSAIKLLNWIKFELFVDVNND